jgi:hypothetical protein
MKSSLAKKAISVKTAKVAAPSLRPMSEVGIQHELDVAILNAEKNRLIQDTMDRREASTARPYTSRKLQSTADAQKPDLHVLHPKKSLKLIGAGHLTSTKEQQEPPINSQEHQVNSKQGVGHSTTISSIQTQLHGMIGEWSCAIKQVFFHEEMELNEDIRQPTQLLILL